MLVLRVAAVLGFGCVVETVDPLMLRIVVVPNNDSHWHFTVVKLTMWI